MDYGYDLFLHLMIQTSEQIVRNTFVFFCLSVGRIYRIISEKFRQNIYIYRKYLLKCLLVAFNTKHEKSKIDDLELNAFEQFKLNQR